MTVKPARPGSANSASIQMKATSLSLQKLMQNNGLTVRSVSIGTDLALERFPKSVTRFSDKKRDQTKNRERVPIRMKREPL